MITSLTIVALFLLKVVIIIFSADFISGLVHWWEDAYGNPNWKFIGKSIVHPNIEHHRYPRKFLQNTFFDRVKISFLTGLVICSVSAFFNLFTLEMGITLFYAALANQVHAMAHRTDKENGKMIVWMQKIGLMQSRKMHGYHHQSPYNVNYCILTNYLNPILNLCKFWNVLELALSQIGIKHNRNHPDRNGY
jgi:ubiquitin-conjugating enzyme E2 variant